MKKLKVFQFVIIVAFIGFIFFLFSAKNYVQEYTLNDIKIKESYDKNSKSYYFLLEYHNINLDYLIEEDYKLNRKLISDIEVFKDNDNFCLIPKGKIEFKPLCYQDKNIISFNLVNDALKKNLSKSIFSSKKKISEYKGIEIYNKNFNYLIWNYNGFYYLAKNETKNIEILKKEIYSPKLIGYTKDYLIIPDYNEDYTFKKLYTINFKNGNLKTLNLDYEIYFDSYFPGYLKNKAYLIDNKEARMYEIDAKKNKASKIKSKLWQENSWENVSIKTLINTKEKFIYKSNYNYTFDNNIIYLNYKNKNLRHIISDNVTSIVKIDNQDIFYLKKDSLYHFNEQTGEELLLKYFEWNFNYENIIYLN